MTAEIAVMNRVAVALAADSAATSIDGGLAKIYQTTEKLFNLDALSPIGVMIYGGADFLGIPWETIVKLFRSRHSQRRPSVRDYSDAFLRFLSADELINDELVDGYFFATACAVLAGLLRRAQEQSSASAEPIPKSLDKVIADYMSNWRALSFFGEMNDTTLSSLLVRYGDWLTKTCNEIFPPAVPIQDRMLDDLKALVALFMTKDVPHASSGCVIAGFGENQLFPSLAEYAIEGVVYPRFARVRTKSSVTITNQINANISPFAQAEMVHSFMTGVDPAFRENVDGVLSAVLTRFSQMAESQAASDLSEEKRSQLKAMLDGAITASMDQFRQELNDYSRRRHIDPVINAVALLPKDQLAVMAETLVALTSFKRKMSKDLETVGGAIDVAVISKGDGFVWIKRKHYFDASLNPRFLDRLKTYGQRHADTSQII
jgi:hypothetical protein